MNGISQECLQGHSLHVAQTSTWTDWLSKLKVNLEVMTFRTDMDVNCILTGWRRQTTSVDSELSVSSELIGGTPSLKINHGSGTLVLQLTNNVGVTDRRWHRLDVKSNSKVREEKNLYMLFSLPP